MNCLTAVSPLTAATIKQYQQQEATLTTTTTTTITNVNGKITLLNDQHAQVTK